ncbi:MAG TPA: fructose-1,6-bisphosphate aldolase, partial [Methylococcaceae bacterium]|nr:fructose-1,6-bisphosphate aldolase [Methylococcaceae bacterium]
YNVARQAMQELCQARYEVFGSAGHASKIKATSLAVMARRYH